MLVSKVCKFVAFFCAAVVFLACSSSRQGDFGSSRSYAKEMNSRFKLNDSYILKFNEFANGQALVRNSTSRTASGEKYLADAFSAAHKTLPFNSIVRVTNLHNGRTSLVRINDRIPLNSSEILIVSKAVANELQMQDSTMVEMEVVAYAFAENSANPVPFIYVDKERLGVPKGNTLPTKSANLNNTSVTAVNLNNKNEKNEKKENLIVENNEFVESKSEISKCGEKDEILVQIGAFKNAQNAQNFANLWAGFKDYTSFVCEENGFFNVFLRNFLSIEEAKDFIKTPTFCDDYVVQNGRVLKYSKNTCKNHKNFKLFD